MPDLSHTPSCRTFSPHSRGFTLIELGIVIATVAILSTAVLVGRGFMKSAGVTKVVETLSTVHKATAVYAGGLGGSLPTASRALLTDLYDRELITFQEEGVPIKGYTFKFAANDANGTSYVVRVACPNKYQAEDVFAAKANDMNLVKAGSINGIQCMGAAPAASTLDLCFKF